MVTILEILIETVLPLEAKIMRALNEERIQTLPEIDAEDNL